MSDLNRPNYGLRFFVLSSIFAPFLFAIGFTLLAPKLKLIYDEMLGGAQLPFITLLVFDYSSVLGIVQLAALCLSAFFLFASKRPDLPFYVSGMSLIAVTFLMIITILAAVLPLIWVISTLNGP